MFPRRDRLPRGAFAKAVYRGEKHSSANFSFVIPGNGEGYAVVVSKKVARLSVTRHRIKRRVLAALKGIGLPRALIVYPKASATGMTYRAVHDELSKLLSMRRK